MIFQATNETNLLLWWPVHTCRSVVQSIAHSPSHRIAGLPLPQIHSSPAAHGSADWHIWSDPDTTSYRVLIWMDLCTKITINNYLLQKIGVCKTQYNVGHRFSKNWRELIWKLEKNKNSSFRSSVFQYTYSHTLVVWEWFFTLCHSPFIFQHHRFNSQDIFLHVVSLHFQFWLTFADN